MARKLRQDHGGAWHHLMNRGAKREHIFLDDDDRRFFLLLLSELEDQFGVEIHAYCLMGNHYHVLVRSQKGGLSQAMHWLGTSYVHRFNWRHGFDGSPFKGRFHAVAVRGDEHLVAAARYIHRNPIDLGFEGRLSTYEWSSLASFLGDRPNASWLRVSEVLRLSGGRSGYRRFVDEANARSDRLVARDGRPTPNLEDLSLDVVNDVTSLDQLDQVLETALGLAAGSIGHTVRGQSNRARQLALVVAFDVHQIEAAELAEHYRFASPASARAAVSKARRCLADDQIARVMVSNLAGRPPEQVALEPDPSKMR